MAVPDRWTDPRSTNRRQPIWALGARGARAERSEAIAEDEKRALTHVFRNPSGTAILPPSRLLRVVRRFRRSTGPAHALTRAAAHPRASLVLGAFGARNGSQDRFVFAPNPSGTAKSQTPITLSARHVRLAPKADGGSAVLYSLRPRPWTSARHRLLYPWFCKAVVAWPLIRAVIHTAEERKSRGAAHAR